MSSDDPESPVATDSALLKAIEEQASNLALQAGALLLDYFHRQLEVAYKSKGHADPVTEADHAAEKLIVDGIKMRFPDHGIITEETPEPEGLDKEFVWVIDPLDGTTNFLNHYPFFGSSIGVLHRGVPVVGALFIPSPIIAGGQVFHARAGGGAFIGDSPIVLAPAETPSPARLSAMPAYFWGQFSVGANLRRNLGEMRVTGSIAYELAMVASEALQFAAFGGPKIWDVAAGIPIIQEAKGKTLVRSRSRRWQAFHSFLEPTTGLPDDGDLRNWRAGLLVGSTNVVEFVADNLRPRSKLWQWWWQMRMRRQPRSKAREQRGESQDTGTQDAPAAPPPDLERH